MGSPRSQASGRPRAETSTTAAPGMRAAGKGHIFFTGSTAGHAPFANLAVYCATKAALDMHACATALDGVAGLRIESLAPGVLDTAMQAEIRDTGAERFPSVARFQAMHRDGGLLSPAEVAQRLDRVLAAVAAG